MADTRLSQLDGQDVELLPARTVMSLFSVDGSIGPALAAREISRQRPR